MRIINFSTIYMQRAHDSREALFIICIANCDELLFATGYIIIVISNELGNELLL